VGSVGVVSLHLDFSKQAEMEGVKPTWITYGRYKVEGNELEPLGEEARAFLQHRVDEYGEMFVKAVARNRGVNAKEVRENFGQGRMFGAKEAKERGLVDRIATLDETLERLGVNVRGAAMAAVKAEREQCPQCHGRRWVVVEDSEETCPTCGGTGQAPEGEGKVRGLEIVQTAEPLLPAAAGAEEVARWKADIAKLFALPLATLDPAAMPTDAPDAAATTAAPSALEPVARPESLEARRRHAAAQGQAVL
jgi:ClpP class serine protease